MPVGVCMTNGTESLTPTWKPFGDEVFYTPKIYTAKAMMAAIENAILIEREACARIAEDLARASSEPSSIMAVAAAIRERK